jgi:hypothetical protein
MKLKNKQILTGILVVVVVIIILCTVHMYNSGGVYRNKISQCKDSDEFCGIKEFSYNTPPSVKKNLELCINKSSIQKRVDIPAWKSGKTIPTSVLVRECPEIISWYKDFSINISKIINLHVEATPLEFETSCCILVYDQKDDFINWHFDVNYFNGRFFTVLIPITVDETCTKYVYKNYNEEETAIELLDDRCIVFEGEKVFHMASKLCEGQKRAVLSLQYSTDSHITLTNKILMRLKDIAYIG